MGRFVRVVGAAIIEDSRCLAAQRSAVMSLPGKWEFPGGKVEPGETEEAALVREIREELGIEIAVLEHLGRTERSADCIRLDVFACSIISGRPHPREHAALQWVNSDEVRSLDWAEADTSFLDGVRRALEASKRALEPG